MRVYYTGPDALVTADQFVWWSDRRRTFLISELRNVRLVQRNMGSPRMILLAASLAAAALIVAPGWLLLDTMTGRLVLIAAAAVAVTLATFRRGGAGQWELRADYRAHEVTVYMSLELRTFNQVTRALRRAVEASSPEPRHPRMAAA